MRWAGHSTIPHDHKRAFDLVRALLAAARRQGRIHAAALLGQRERWVLALPVPLAVGIGTYHGLPFEPPTWWIGLASALILTAGLVAWWRTDLVRRAAAVGAAVLLTGLVLAQWQTMRLEQPRLERPEVHAFEARVVLVEPRAAGARLTLDLVPRSAAWPHRVRVTARSLAEEVHVGDLVRLRARLMPPSEPVLPGGFDFGRWAYFKGIGAVGYAYGAVERVAATDRATPASAEVRRWIARHAVSVLPGETGGVAAALLTGLRGDISDDVWDHMQRSGLAHVLAISGLHIGLVAGTVFIFTRYLVCLWPWLALRVMAHRVAAVAALLVAFLYLLLAGAPVPTQRAFMMTGIVLVGLMLDRDAISLRLVALAACVVLIIDPAALMGASFQMSFAAVTGLVAVYERWRLRRPDREAGAPSLLVAYFAGVAITTLIATAATAPFAAYHFGRLPTYGIAANLIAVPIMALWIMPLGLVSQIMMPFGLDGPPLRLMGWGIDVMLWAAAVAASWPAASLSVPQPPLAALVLLAMAGLWAALWWGRLARLAWLPAAIAALWFAAARPPDIIVDRSAGMAALRADRGAYVLAVQSRDGFVLRGWSRALGIDTFVDPGAARAVDCDDRGCRLRRDDLNVAIALRPNALIEDCAADLVLNLATDTTCPGTPTITRGELYDRGALALRLAPTPHRRFVYKGGERRPWERATSSP